MRAPGVLAAWLLLIHFVLVRVDSTSAHMWGPRTRPNGTYDPGYQHIGYHPFISSKGCGNPSLVALRAAGR